MRMLLAALAAVLVAAPVLASPPPATTGPFAGTVGQDETDTHAYDNNPTGNPCIQLAQTYTVSLEYAPTSDQLTLTAAGYTSTGHSGIASISFQRGVCAAFTITVTGTSVADSAAYVVAVNKLPPVLCCLS